MRAQYRAIYTNEYGYQVKSAEFNAVDTKDALAYAKAIMPANLVDNDYVPSVELAHSLLPEPPAYTESWYETQDGAQTLKLSFGIRVF